MRRISRIEQSTNLLRVRASSRTPSPYLCRACKQNSASFSTTGLQAAANSPGFTEKIRRKIWGTDSPPGAEDPYGGLSRFDRTKQKELEQEQEQEQGQQLEQTASDPAELPADYQPSDTWHGLDIVGDEVAMFKRRWRSEHKFEGFVPNYVMRNTAEITANLRRAIIEVLAQRQVGKTTALSTIASGDDLTHTVKLGYAESGLSLDFGSQERFEYIVQSLAPVQETIEQEEPTLAEEGVAAEPTTEDPLETASTGSETAASAEDVQDESTWKGLTQTSAQSYDEMVAGWDSSWLQIPLDNPEVKFAVVKRTMQLTGIRISDSLINNVRTPQGLLSHMLVAPKPRKLVDRLTQEKRLKLPNVNVSAKRVTPIDKEKRIGRWKLIEKELQERDLPVTGKYSDSEKFSQRQGFINL